MVRTRIALASVSLLAVACCLLDVRPAPAQAPAAPPPLPADLDVVPRAAAGFLHVRARDFWLSEWMAPNHGYRIVTFWGGPLSGTWPPSRTVRDYYRTLQRDFGA